MPSEPRNFGLSRGQGEREGFVRARPPDIDQRELAAGELEKNLVVLAGAGTGKTTLLIDRLTLLLIGKEIPIEKIVALTFTKKAAEEMRERLERRLREIVAGKSNVDLLETRFSANKPKWSVLAQKALDDIPKAQIGTIHGFAGHLLRLYPLQAGVDPKFREDKGPIAEAVFDSLWAAWITGELAEGAPKTAEWLALLQRVTLTELRGMARVLIGPMVDLTALKASPDLKPFIAEGAARLDAIRKKYPEPTRAKTFLQALDALALIFALTAKKKPVPADLINQIKRLEKDPIKGWEEEEYALAALAGAGKSLALVDDALFARVHERLLPFVRSVRRRLARVGAVSFDGLLVFARDLLRDHADVRASLKKRFETFLVDEFQDTDPLQGEILFYLAEAPGANAARWQDVVLAPGRLFVVGDPKQSIYRFRGADIAAFEAFEEHMRKQGAIKATLSANFRSDPRILNFVNTIFPPVMQEEKYLQPPYSPLEAGRGREGEGETGRVRVVKVTGEEEEKLSAESRRMVEAQTLADWIVAQSKAGLAYSQIAVLLRSANAFDEYLEAFRSRGIPYLAEGEKSFYRTSEVVDFLNLLAVIANPEDRLALVGVLRSPVGGLTDREIWDLKTADGLSFLKPSRILREKVGALYETLRALSQEAKERPLGDVIEHVFSRTWALELASTSAHGEQAAANLLKIGRLAEIWAEQSPMTLAEFVARFNKYREDAHDEGENPLADVKYDAVKVLTIHKAKGLEFPVVVLPNLSAGARGGPDDAPLRRDWRTGLVGLRLQGAKVTNAAMALVEQQEKDRARAEEVRVFYVAATRARSQLVCFVGGHESNKGRFAEIVRAATDLPGVQVDEVQEKPLVAEDFSRPLLTLSPAWDPAKLAERIKVRAAEAAALHQKRLLLSPTSLLAEPDKFRLPEEDELVSRETAIQIGHICHKVMEDWDFVPFTAKQKGALRKVIDRAARLYELTPEDGGAETIKEIETMMTAFLSSDAYKKLTEVKILGKELPFVFPGEGFAMRGVIDLLYESDGRLVVADYKTNKVEGGALKATVDHYRVQGAAYQEAVRRSLGKEVAFELIFLRHALTVPVRLPS